MAESRNSFLSKLAAGVTSDGDISSDAIAPSVTQSLGTSVYDSASLLPIVGNTAGDTAFVKSTSRLYIHSGLGWYNVAVINNTPTVQSILDSDGGTTPFVLATDGTPTTITITAQDSDGDPLTYNYSADSDFSGLATLSQDANVFTITPFSSDSATTTSGTITFTVTDGINTATPAAQTFTLSFLSALWDETVLSIGTSSTNSLDNSTFIDRSTNAHTVTATGSPVQTAFHPYLDNWSVEFDGSGDDIEFASDTSLAFGTGDYTVEMWVYFTGISDSTLQILYRSGTGDTTFLFHADGNQLSVGTPSVFVSNQSTTFNTGQWYHVAACRSGSTLRLFKDGVQVGSNATDNTNWTSTNTAGIGEDGTGIQRLYGYMSNARVVKGTALYTSTFTPPTEKLTAVSGTSLLTCQSNRFIDNSTNAHTITPAGNVKISSYNPFGQGSEYSRNNQLGSLWFGDTDNDATIQVTDGTVTDFGTDDFTIEFWFYPSGTIATTTYTIVNGFNNPGTSGTAEFYIQTSGQNLRLTWNAYTSSWTTVAYSNTDWKPYQWTHAAFVRNGTSCKIYQNGVEVASATVASDQSFNNDFSNTRIGGNQGNTSEFRGYLADFRITKGTAVYTSAFTPPIDKVGAGSSTVYLPFDNAGIFDKTGNNTLTLAGNTSTSTTQTKFADTAMYFDGSGDFARITNMSSFGTNSFTVEGWIYNLSGGVSRNIADARAGSSWAIQANSNEYKVYDEVAATYIHTTTGSFESNNLNSWVHIAWCRSGSTSRFFINGTQVGSDVSNSSNYQNTSLRIGSRFSEDQQYFQGYIENFQILKGVAKYTANFTPPTQEQGRIYQAED